MRKDARKRKDDRKAERDPKVIGKTTDAYHRLNREGQNIIFRLHSGHDRLKKTCIQNSQLVQAPTVHVAISLKQLSSSSRIAHFMQN